MKQGTVYFHRGCRFHDGEIGDKLFIILNTPRQNEYYITCKTTSQQKWRSNKEGCNSTDNYYVIRENDDFFIERTWIQFHEYYRISQELIQRFVKNGIITKKADLRNQTIKAIINCVGKSEDISGLYWSMINR
jgi:hypothetical protein